MDHIQTRNRIEGVFQVVKAQDRSGPFGKVGSYAAQTHRVADTARAQGRRVGVGDLLLPGAEVARTVVRRDHHKCSLGTFEGSLHRLRVIHGAGHGLGATLAEPAKPSRVSSDYPHLFALGQEPVRHPAANVSARARHDIQGLVHAPFPPRSITGNKVRQESRYARDGGAPTDVAPGRTRAVGML